VSASAIPKERETAREILEEGIDIVDPSTNLLTRSVKVDLAGVGDSNFLYWEYAQDGLRWVVTESAGRRSQPCHDPVEPVFERAIEVAVEAE